MIKVDYTSATPVISFFSINELKKFNSLNDIVFAYFKSSSDTNVYMIGGLDSINSG